MPIREEGVSLRFGADIAGLRAGKREIQDWSKEVERLSTLVKRGLATPQDITRLRDFQETAKRGYDALETKLQSYQKQREQYLSQIGIAPTAQARLQAMGGARGAQMAMYQTIRQQQALQQLGGAAAPPGAPGGPSPVGAALGFAKRIPVVGGLLTAAGAAMGAMGAYRGYAELEKRATNIALAFGSAGENLAGMTQEIRTVGREMKFLDEESTRAVGAMMAAGGVRMRGPMAAEVMRFARLKGIAPEQLGGLTGTMLRAGAAAPGGQKFLSLMEGMRLQTGRNPLALQQYMQNILPFLQSEGRFQPYTGRNLNAATRLQAAMVGDIPQVGPLTTEQATREEFVRRNMGGMLQSISQGIRAPQGPAAQFFMMRAMGLGDPGVSLYGVRRRMQAGLTPENLIAVARGLSGRGREEFGFAAERLFGIPLAQAETLRQGMQGVLGGRFTQEEAIARAEQTITEMQKGLAKTPADALLDIDATLDSIKKDIGQKLVDNIVEINREGIQVLRDILNELMGRGERGIREVPSRVVTEGPAAGMMWSE